MQGYECIIILYLVFINLIAVCITVYDKKCAKKHLRRIPERTLMFISAVGGSVFMYITMKLIRHKTKHKKFMIGIPIIFLSELGAVLILAYYLMR